jgi:hypothetical protein
MNKRQLHHLWTLIRPVRAWYLLTACGIFGLIAVVALRANYTGMVSLRTAVYDADKNNGNVEQSLQKLRAYVGNHMNTNLDTDSGIYPPIHLKYTYDRLVKAEQTRVETVNSQVYTDAQKHCEALYPNSFSGGPRVPCIQEYVKEHGTTAKSIPNALYKFNFVSPRWSPDVAGWSIVFSVLFLAFAGLRFGLGRWLTHYLR